MTDAPETRTTHVIRIAGTNKAGDVLQDMWADLERTDSEKSATQTMDSSWQGQQRQLRWLDDPDGPDGAVEPRTRDGVPVGPGSRDVITVKVCSPDESDLSDPEQWIPVDAIKHMRSRRSDQNLQDSHVNEVLTDARVVKNRRVFHRDTSIDDAAQAAFDADPTRKVYVVPGGQYTFVDGTEDRDQYVEEEVVVALKSRGNDQTDTGAGSDQGMQLNLQNQYVIDQTDDAKLKEVGPQGFNPPYRLDPYQNIVNVQFKSVDQQWLLGRKSTEQIGDGFNIWPGPYEADAKDGTIKTGVTNGASGSGFTVLSTGCVAFGSVKDGKTSRSCFLRSAALVTANTQPPCPVFISAVNNGELVWNLLWTAPGPVIALSYANDAFFITYLTQTGSGASNLAVVRDVNDIKSGINPFPRTLNTENNGDEWGGNVAYNKATKRYACVGAHFKFTLDFPNRFASNNLFAWSSSSDGLSWSDGMTDDFFDGLGAQSAGQRTTICAGNGVFVAAAAQKHKFLQFPQFDNPPDPDEFFVLHSSAVAVSADGKSWTAVALPGALIESPRDPRPGFGYLGGTESDAWCVAFIEDKDFADPVAKRTGYFVVGDIGNSNLNDAVTSTSMLWISLDGFSWNRSVSYDYAIVASPPDFVFPNPQLNYWSLTAITKKLSTTKLVIV